MPRKGNIPRVCETCAVPFLSHLSEIRKGGGRYCSKACYGASRSKQIARTCERCGAGFTTTPWYIEHGAGRFCSMSCSSRGRARTPKTALPTATCATCANDFAYRPSRNPSPPKFCSKACFGISRRTKIERPCEVCGRAFNAIPSEVAKGKGRMCSRACADAALVVPLASRIERDTEKRAPDECWLWMGKRHERGYGEITDRGRNLRVTRIVLEAKLGRPLGAGMMALHACSNPPCCNPAHLFEGSHKQNMEQRKAEGKYPTGTAHPMSRVNRAQRFVHPPAV